MSKITWEASNISLFLLSINPELVKALGEQDIINAFAMDNNMGCVCLFIWKTDMQLCAII